MLGARRGGRGRGGRRRRRRLALHAVQVPSHAVPGALVGSPLRRRSTTTSATSAGASTTETTRQDGTEPGEIAQRPTRPPARAEGGRHPHVVRVLGAAAGGGARRPRRHDRRRRPRPRSTAAGLESCALVAEQPSERRRRGHRHRLADGDRRRRCPRGRRPLVRVVGRRRSTIPDVIGRAATRSRSPSSRGWASTVDGRGRRDADDDRSRARSSAPTPARARRSSAGDRSRRRRRRPWSTVPDVTGMTLDEAREALEDAGLTVGQRHRPGRRRVWTWPLRHRGRRDAGASWSMRGHA